MNDRERFLATMGYRARDRAPICDFGFWPETLESWHEQGLPRHVIDGHSSTHTAPYLGMDAYEGGPCGDVRLRPAFEWKVIEDRGEQEVVRDDTGVLQLRQKRMGSIPMHLGHTLVDRASWEAEFKPRLDPDDPRRLPQGEALTRAMTAWRDEACPFPRRAFAGSLYGWIRDWMGVDNASLLVYDDPGLFEEMVTTLADVTVGVYSKLFAIGARFDCVAMWEDMCYSGGPLLSPAHFKRFLVPQYERITRLFREHGTDLVWVDCDGKIDDLIPLWLGAGVNCMFPIEVGTWGGDPVRYRREYGRDLRMMGGFDKHILAQGPSAIKAEVARLAPTVEQGGFIPFCDHRVPPDVTFANYLFYLEEARRVWGRGVNLKPAEWRRPVEAATR